MVAMPDFQVPNSSFSGLNLVDAPDSVGDQCIDALNIDLDRSGTRVRSRDGFAKFSTAASANARPWSYVASFYDSSNAVNVIVLSDSAGTSSEYGDGPASFSASTISHSANIGTPSSNRLFVDRGTANTVSYIHNPGTGIAQVNPTATVNGTSGLAMPKGGPMAVQQPDNRLAVAPSNSTGGPNGAASSGSHVWFSEPGDPLTWNNNYVQLAPGDSETIQALVNWGSQFFAFKQSHAWIFYGNSTDAAGNPIFNNRPIELPSKVVGGCVTAGEDGVYFVTRDGVYVTTGSSPTLLSGDLYPLATDQALPSHFTALNARWSDAATIHFHKRRLFVSLRPGSGTAGTLVYDIDTANWFPWSISPTKFFTHDLTNGPQYLYFIGDPTGNQLYRFQSIYTTDAGNAINSRYRTGFDDFGTVTEKVLRETEMWGTGTVAVSSSQNFGSLGTADNVTLGTAPRIDWGRFDGSPGIGKGTLFSHKFASVNGGAWSLHRYNHNVQANRGSGLKSPDN